MLNKKAESETEKQADINTEKTTYLIINQPKQTKIREQGLCSILIKRNEKTNK